MPDIDAPAPPLRVLVIEDVHDARDALAEAIALLGHRASAEAGGVAGLAALLALRPEVALIDLGLPDIDGHEVARRARAGGLDATFLVALTGLGGDDARRRALAAGFDDHLPKPVDLERLDDLLARRAVAQPGSPASTAARTAARSASR